VQVEAKLAVTIGNDMARHDYEVEKTAACASSIAEEKGRSDGTKNTLLVPTIQGCDHVFDAGRHRFKKGHTPGNHLWISPRAIEQVA